MAGFAARGRHAVPSPGVPGHCRRGGIRPVRDREEGFTPDFRFLRREDGEETRFLFWDRGRELEPFRSLPAALFGLPAAFPAPLKRMIKAGLRARAFSLSAPAEGGPFQAPARETPFSASIRPGIVLRGGGKRTGRFRHVSNIDSHKSFCRVGERK